MTLQSAIEAELPNLRREAESRMTSRATVRRKVPGGSTDADGFPVDGWDVVYASLPFRLGGGQRSRTRRVGDSEVEVAVRVAHFPASTDTLRDGDLIEATSGENAGLVLQVVEVSWQDQATARRVPVVETQRPTEWP